MGEGRLRLARAIALAAPLMLLGGAYVSQYGFGLVPCEMCWWQRYAHFAALPFALLAFALPRSRIAIALAALAIAVSSAIGAFHAGVEYHWWEGLTRCSVSPTADDIWNNLKVVRCDEVQWSLFGISLAGWNFLFSGAAALAIFALLARAGRKIAI
jgi:disulfide bond formation protein DsbB